jgi:Ca-activated chloride channel homolog
VIILAFPWLLVLLPVPWLLARILPPHREPRSGLNVPFLDRLAQVTGQKPGESSVVLHGRWLRQVVLLLSWACLVVAMARPQLIEPPVTRTLPVRDLLLAIDLSGSMDTKDFTDAKGEKIQRLAAVKEVLDGFLARQKDQRVGLIFSGPRLLFKHLSQRISRFVVHCSPKPRSKWPVRKPLSEMRLDLPSMSLIGANLPSAF